MPTYFFDFQACDGHTIDLEGEHFADLDAAKAALAEILVTEARRALHPGRDVTLDATIRLGTEPVHRQGIVVSCHFR